MRVEIRAKQTELRMAESEHRTSMKKRDDLQQQSLALRGTLNNLQLQGTEEPLPPDTQHLQDELATVTASLEEINSKISSYEEENREKQNAGIVVLWNVYILIY